MPHAELEIKPHYSILSAEWAVSPDLNIDDGSLLEHFSLRVPPEYQSEFQPQQQYTTQWRGGATLEEILSDKNVQNVAFAKMRSFGYTDQDAEDCFQLGSINFWKMLKDQPDILYDKRAAWVGVWIALAGSRRSLWKHKARCIPLDDSDRRINRPERWATFATRVDEQIDFSLLMNSLAQRYDGNPLKLYALYSLTTSVAMKDVISSASVHKNQMVDARNVVKKDLRALLQPDDRPSFEDKNWIAELKRGENLDCVARVAEKIVDNQRLLLALYVVTTSATKKDVIELFSIGRTAFRKEINQIKIMLAEEYRKSRKKAYAQR